MIKHIALLHTVPGLAERFHGLIQDQFEPGTGPRIDHIVDPWLLAQAIREGITLSVVRRVSDHVGYLASGGAGIVMITCSSIGGIAKTAASRSGIPVLRVDAPMAAEAVAIAGGRTITVLATLRSTLGPTVALVSSSANGDPVDVRAVIVAGAADAKNRGEVAVHDELIRQAVVEASGTSAVIVLAQASMAAALDGVATSVPVLSSPNSGVQGLLEAMRG